MMLAGVPVIPIWVSVLAKMVKDAGAVDLADRLDRANHDGVRQFALTIDDCAIILGALEDPPDWFAEQRAVIGDGLVDLRAVLLNGHQWRQREGLDP